MNDALLVRGFQCFGDLPGSGQRFIEWHRSLRDPISERRPLDQLHHEGRHAVALLQAVNLRNVRMIQPGEHFRFALEARHARGIARHGRGQHLDGDGPL